MPMVETNGAAADAPTLAQWADTVELLTERIAELELASEDVWWRPLGVEGPTEFSRAHLRTITRQSRLYYLKNPLINRAVTLQAIYVFGQGLSITGRATPVDAVIQAFLDDMANQTELTSHQARVLKEIALQLEGNLFFVLFTNRQTGQVRIRTLPVDEVDDIITSPDDAKEAWYYRRTWQQRSLDLATGRDTTTQQTAYYPDWRYRPAQRPATIGTAPVQWDTPVYHVKVGGLPDMRFGIPETYAALDWASAYKKFLENWATIVDSLSRFAWKLSPKGGARGVAAAKQKLGTTFGSPDGALDRNPPPTAGSIAILPEGADLTPMPKTGATVVAEDGRRLLLMVCAALGIPEPMFGDANVGNHATAKTLDRPTELKFMDRRTLWTDVLLDVLGYVVDQAAVAEQGPLRLGPRAPGDQIELAPDPATGEPVDRGINVDFPSILEHDQNDAVNAVVAAATLAGHPPVGILDNKLIARLLLQALGVGDIDELLSELFPDPEADTPDDATDAGADTGGAGAPGAADGTAPAPADSSPTSVAAQEAARLTLSAADVAAARAWAQELGLSDYLHAQPVRSHGKGKH